MQVSLRKDSANLTIVTVGTLELAFSYETVVGFREGSTSWVLSENVWSTTTGKHLNQIADKSARIDRQEFLQRVDALLTRFEEH